jgi:flagellar protein FliS
MRLHKLAFDGYGAVQVATGVATADSNKLILMLFDGLMESLAAARGHIDHGNAAGKSKALSRASRIVLGLQGALDFERGGDLARNLDDLYAYVTRRLLHVNAYNDVVALDEVRSLMSEIRDAWASLPGLMPGRPQPALTH